MEIGCISCDTNKESLKKSFQNICNFTQVYYPFPGGLPVSMTKKSFSAFNKFIYRMCDKSNGTRYMLYLTIDEESKNRIGYLVNRSMNFYKVNVDLGAVVHIGSVLDGELVKRNNGEWVYLVFDVFAVKGTTIKDTDDHNKRLKTIENNKYLNNSTNNFTIKIKKFFNMDEFDSMVEYNKSLDYETDGLIFTPINRKIYNGTDRGTFKWKPTSENTIDFEIKCDSDNKYRLVLWDNKSKMEINKVFVTKEMSDEINQEKKIPIIVECKWLPHPVAVWAPIMIRKDKSHPNSVKTYMSTLETIDDDITLDDIKNINK
tara:strand:+ start:66 stop:1013 length:948 start_codon:yes stop_codon:yes gene_type:complete